MTLDQYRQLLRDKMDHKPDRLVRVIEEDGNMWQGWLRDFGSLDYVDYGTEEKTNYVQTDFTGLHLKSGFYKFIVYVVPYPPASVKTHWPDYRQVEIIGEL